jgi:hypothetical protein
LRVGYRMNLVSQGIRLAAVVRRVLAQPARGSLE